MKNTIKWNDANGLPPSLEIPVLVAYINKYGGYGIDIAEKRFEPIYMKSYWHFLRANDGDINVTITHWMELPEHPHKDNFGKEMMEEMIQEMGKSSSSID